MLKSMMNALALSLLILTSVGASQAHELASQVKLDQEMKSIETLEAAASGSENISRSTEQEEKQPASNISSDLQSMDYGFGKGLVTEICSSTDSTRPRHKELPGSVYAAGCSLEPDPACPDHAQTCSVYGEECGTCTVRRNTFTCYCDGLCCVCP